MMTAHHSTSFTKDDLPAHLERFQRVLDDNANIKVTVEHLDSAGFQFLLALNKACVSKNGRLTIQSAADLAELFAHNGWISNVEVV